MNFDEPLLIGCAWSNNEECHVKHCHSCKRKMDYSCICSDCTCECRDNWLNHLHEHKEKNKPRPEECNFCALALEGVGSR